MLSLLHKTMDFGSLCVQAVRRVGEIEVLKPAIKVQPEDEFEKKILTKLDDSLVLQVEKRLASDYEMVAPIKPYAFTKPENWDVPLASARELNNSLLQDQEKLSRKRQRKEQSISIDFCCKVQVAHYYCGDHPRKLFQVFNKLSVPLVDETTEKRQCPQKTSKECPEVINEPVGPLEEHADMLWTDTKKSMGIQRKSILKRKLSESDITDLSSLSKEAVIIMTLCDTQAAGKSDFSDSERIAFLGSRVKELRESSNSRNESPAKRLKIERSEM